MEQDALQEGQDSENHRDMKVQAEPMPSDKKCPATFRIPASTLAQSNTTQILSDAHTTLK